MVKSVEGTNIGPGLPICAGSNNQNDVLIGFKTLIGASGVVITEDAKTVRVDLDQNTVNTFTQNRDNYNAQQQNNQSNVPFTILDGGIF